MTEAYEPRHWTDRHLAAVAAVLAVGIWAHASGGPVDVVFCGLLGLVSVKRADVTLATVLILTFVVGAVVGGHAWAGTSPRSLGPFAGWATIVEDPAPVGAGVGTVVEIEGERFRATAFGAMRHRLERLEAGDRVELVGRRVDLSGTFARRARARHIVGDVRIERLGDTAPGTPLSLASNRVRGMLRDGAAAAMSPDDAALFTGLVIGDDIRQQPATVEAFRRSGLSHLTAVSGQNVTFVIALAGLVVRPLSRWWRLLVTIAVIAWFAVITRLEPSVLRAGVMAALSATAFALGRDRSPARLLAIAVIALLLVDPLLLWSVAFWLSSGATFGVTVLAPRIERRLGGPPWLAAAVAVTIGAELGVLAPSLLVFGRFPVLGLPANLCAVPVAGAVMLYGLPAGMLAGALPASLAKVVLAPAAIGTRWVAVTARTAAMLEPAGAAAVVVVLVQVAALGLLVQARWRRPPSPVER